MSGLGSFLVYALWMLVAGLGIPLMATLNGALGTRLQSPTLATTILFGAGFLISLVYGFATGSFPKSLARDVPPHLYSGAVFVLFYVLSVTAVAPRFGIGNAIAFVLLGQLLSMAVIDHFQLFGALHFPLTWQRLAGLVLMTVGVFLAVRRG